MKKKKGCKSLNTSTNSTSFIKLNPISLKKSKSISSSYPTTYPKLCRQFINPEITVRRHWNIHTTDIEYLYSAATDTTWLYATVDGGDSSNPPPCHPLTYKPYPINIIDLSKFQTCFFTDFNHTDFPFDKLVLSPSRSTTAPGDAMVVLYGGGRLFGRHPLVAEDTPVKWVELSGEKFDDIVVFQGITYVVDRLGGLFEIDNYVRTRKLKLGKMVAARVVEYVDGSGQSGWRNRFVEGRRGLYMVIRMEEDVFTVYKLIKRYRSVIYWSEIEEFDEDEVAMFVSKEWDLCLGEFVGREYKNCIMFSKAGFPSYGDDGWEYDDGEDEIMVFRLTDGAYGRVGRSVEFPESDWSPPSCLLDGGSCSSSHPRSQSDGEPNEDDKELEGAESDSNSRDQEQEERSDSDIQDHDAEEEMHSNGDTEDTSLQEDVVPASLIASVFAVVDEVTKTVLGMNGGNEAVLKVSSRENIALSGPRGCSTSTIKGCKSDSATAKFEGFDIRSDLVPALQKIWRSHGNVIENSTIRSSDIIARALESLATMVDILENVPVQLLSDYQAGYLSTTLSDLKIMGFKVHWLVSFVEKAVKLHKSKTLVDSLNKLSKLSSQVKERRDILLDKVAKLAEDENELKKEMAKMSKLIPFSGQIKFDEPLGSGLK